MSDLSHFAINEGYAVCISWAVLSKILWKSNPESILLMEISQTEKDTVI